MSQFFGPENGHCPKKFFHCNGMTQMPECYFIQMYPSIEAKENKLVL
jgi:hypothetical protein